MHISYFDATNADLKYAVKTPAPAPDISVTPTDIDFGNVYVGQGNVKVIYL